MSEKVLIIDDDPETVRLISLVLNRQGFQTLSSFNGQDGINQARREQPDLVLLDVMMPDMDGYQVTKILRNTPDTSNIPILMFSAKSQVDDRVSGYESGIDDYITKPIHPAELLARVKSLISRTKTITPVPQQKGYTIGIIAPVGGLGCSTLALNLAIKYYQNSRQNVTAAELRPGHGSWGTELRLKKFGLSNLLSLNPSAITAAQIEKELLKTNFGVRVLVASNTIKDYPFINAQEQIEKIVRQLPLIAPLTILDLGSSPLPNLVNILEECNEIMLVTSPYPSTINFTKDYLNELNDLGLGKSQILNIVMINRVRADLQLTITKCEEMLGQIIHQVISPVPEISHQAALHNKPLIIQSPADSLIVQQYHKLAENVIENTRI